MECNVRKQESIYWFATACLLFVSLIASSGCGSIAPPLEVTTLTLPRSEVRDAIRDGATLANGEPLFARIENDYGFDGSRFQLTGMANADSGTPHEARLELTFAIRDDEVRFEIDDHNLQLTADEIERLNDAISAEFMRSIEATMGRTIHGYDAIQVGEYGLAVTLRVEPMAGVVPLNP